GQRATDIRDAHRLPAVAAVPVRDDDLVGDRTGQQVPEHVHAPRRVVLDRRSMEVPEPLKREAGQSGTGDNQISRVEPVRQQWAGPDRQQDRDWRPERHHLLCPLMIVAQVIVEERDVVVRQAGREPERDEGRRDDPRSVEPGGSCRRHYTSSTCGLTAGGPSYSTGMRTRIGRSRVYSSRTCAARPALRPTMKISLAAAAGYPRSCRTAAIAPST